MVKVLRDDLRADNPPDPPDAYGIGYTALAWSQDGEHWTREREPFFDRDPRPGAWDHAHAWIDEQVAVGDDVCLYYGGYARGHKVNRFEERQIGLVKMRRDRYVAREAGADGGTIETPVVVIDGDTLTINADAGGGGGGGGGGGCGGTGGSGGSGGGGSIAILLVNSNVTAVNVTVATGTAGNGGAGRSAGDGGPHGIGGLGGSGHDEGYFGGRGGDGGSGGRGGYGGGGAGGWSVGVYRFGSASWSDGGTTTPSLGLAGSGGSAPLGGNPGGNGTKIAVY
jgi:hypothetical protein